MLNLDNVKAVFTIFIFSFLKKSCISDKAEITNFSINNVMEILIVNETAHVHFGCNVDSNPSSMMVMEFNNKIVSAKSNTQTLDYLITSVNCTDTGTYVCTGNNTYNTGQRARLETILIVTCKYLFCNSNGCIMHNV